MNVYYLVFFVIVFLCYMYPRGGPCTIRSNGLFAMKFSDTIKVIYKALIVQAISFIACIGHVANVHMQL